LHAEMVAIKNACKNRNAFHLQDCRLYTSCEPCPMCLSAIYWAHIPVVIYGNTKNDAKSIGFDDSFIYDEIQKPNDERKIHMQHLEPEYAKCGFISWENHKSRIHY
jgi:guanine deaminase